MLHPSRQLIRIANPTITLNLIRIVPDSDIRAKEHRVLEVPVDLSAFVDAAVFRVVVQLEEERIARALY
jgi:hypothetical protein